MGIIILLFILMVHNESTGVKNIEGEFSEFSNLRHEMNNGLTEKDNLGPLALAYHDILEKKYYFEDNQYEIRQEDRLELIKFANLAIEFPDFNIQIRGYADGNLTLALLRANGVERDIIGMGVSNKVELMSSSVTGPRSRNANHIKNLRIINPPIDLYFDGYDKKWSYSNRVEVSLTPPH
jgi:outer membrane protein OmpA-like peptidoglycan-associated protein